jgi:hypothetical protein
MKNLFAATALVTSLLAAGSAGAAVNLIVNGDFETPIGDPNTAVGRGFDTDYAYRSGAGNTSGDPNSMYAEGTWTINTNPYNTHDLWVNQELNGTNVLILNGKTTGLPSIAWSQEFAVGGGLYEYSFDVYNIYAGGLPSHINFEYSTDGGANYIWLDQVETAPPGDAGVEWHRAGTFSVGAGLMRVSLRNTEGGFGGNDFAIDNIFVGALGVPEPATWAMMIVGFGGIGAALRGRRRTAVAA